MNFLSCFFLTITMFACSQKISSEGSSAGHDTNKATVSASPQTATPACILSKIDSIKKDPVWNPPAEIYEYEYQGKKVYAISSNCCDFFNTVVDANCTYVCAPSGGFTGRGDGKCANFFKEAKQLRLVWKDERTRK
ncbi:DUF6970 domain-containing protein [Segetibacter aerophilus]|nr:hypothetical protein [Segetibacter aerophilus]